MFLIPASYLHIKKTKKKGRGVFALKPIAAGTVIGDYLGKIVKDREAERLEKRNGGICFSMDYTGGDTSIYPDIKSPGIHIINHSCAPNCDAYYYFGHTLYFALRRIFPGEELTVDYGFDPRSDDTVSYCLCGSPFCHGTMYAGPEKLTESRVFFQKQTRGQHFKICQPGEILQPLAKYPSKIKDFVFYDLAANLEVAPISYNDKKLPNIHNLRRRLRDSGRILKFSRLGFSVLRIVKGTVIVRK